MNINEVTYRHTIKTINSLTDKFGYKLFDARNSKYSGNFQVLEFNEGEKKFITCGVYFSKKDALDDLLKFVKKDIK